VYECLTVHTDKSKDRYNTNKEEKSKETISGLLIETCPYKGF